MRLLITGANGQLGRSLQRVLEHEPDIEAICSDVDTLDLTDADAVMQNFTQGGYDVVVNCAAYTAVDRAETEPAKCALINTEAVGNLAKAARATGCRVIHISTDYVFDGHGYKPYKETDIPNPQSTYGRTKLDGEAVLMSFCRDAVILRTSWLYSEYGSNFVKTMMRLGREKDELGVVADQIGTPTYASDLARAIVDIIRADKWMPGIYHFSNNGVASWYDFTLAIHRLAGIEECRVKPLSTDQYPTAAKRPHYSVLSKQKITDTYNIHPPYWLDSLDVCIANILSDEATNKP